MPDSGTSRDAQGIEVARPQDDSFRFPRSPANGPQEHPSHLQGGDAGHQDDRGRRPPDPIRVPTMATPRCIPDHPYMSSSPVLSTLSSTTRSTSPEYGFGTTPRHTRFQSLELVSRFKSLDVCSRPPTTPSILSSEPNERVADEVSAMEKMTDGVEEAEVGAVAVHEKFEAGSVVHDDEDAMTDDEDGEDDWETQSTSSDADEKNDCSEKVVAYTLRSVFGIDSPDLALPCEVKRKLVRDFVQNLSTAICNLATAPPTVVTAQGSTSGVPQGIHPSEGNGPNGQGRQGSRKGKRKKDGSDPGQNGGGDDAAGRDRESGQGATKRLRPSQKSSLRLSCPFRKRNPCRFNCRDFYSCSFTYFTSFADLKQHLAGPGSKHTLEDTTAFVCPRCNRSFPSRPELQVHSKVPIDQLCESRDHDPEDGVDSSTAATILSRKWPTSGSVESQWKELWKVLFPLDARPRPYSFHAPIEHFEFAETYRHDLPKVHHSLRPLNYSDIALNTLCGKFLDHFMSVMEYYSIYSREMQYVNRQGNRRSVAPEPQPAQPTPPPSQRDSAVVMDAEPADRRSTGSRTSSTSSHTQNRVSALGAGDRLSHASLMGAGMPASAPANAWAAGLDSPFGYQQPGHAGGSYPAEYPMLGADGGDVPLGDPRGLNQFTQMSWHNVQERPNPAVASGLGLRPDPGADVMNTDAFMTFLNSNPFMASASQLDNAGTSFYPARSDGAL